MHIARFAAPVLLLVAAMLPFGAHAAGLRPVASQADRELLDHAYYCETQGALAALDAGANIDVINSGGFTALMTAALMDCDALAGELIARGARLDPVTEDGQSALDLARDNSPKVTARLEAALGGGEAGAAVEDPLQAAALGLGTTAGGDRADAVPPGGPAEWPPLGYYKPGQQVIHTATGVIWTPGVVKRVMPDYGYSVDYDVPYRSGVAGVTREPFWTAWFFGDWEVRVPSAYTAIQEHDRVHISVTSGQTEPPLHIDPDGTYVWQVGFADSARVIEGHWDPNPDAPGVILRNGEFGADWLVANMTDNTDDRERAKIFSHEHTGYQAYRME